MQFVRHGLIVLTIGVLGMWGCARRPGNVSAPNAEQVRVLESKCSQLTNDYQAAANARDQARRRSDTLQAERDGLKRQIDALQAVVQERDQLQKQVETRTSERDALQQRNERIKKGLQNLLGQDDAMLSPASSPAVDATQAGRS
jgi:uncharacterized coiled-coil DUF342 family protein